MANSPLLTMPILRNMEGVTLCDSDYCHYPLCEEFVVEGVRMWPVPFNFSTSESSSTVFYFFLPTYNSDKKTNGYFSVGGSSPGMVAGSIGGLGNPNWSGSFYPDGLNFPSCSLPYIRPNCLTSLITYTSGVGGGVEFRSQSITLPQLSSLPPKYSVNSYNLPQEIKDMCADGKNSYTIGLDPARIVPFTSVSKSIQFFATRQSVAIPLNGKRITALPESLGLPLNEFFWNDSARGSTSCGVPNSSSFRGVVVRGIHTGIDRAVYLAMRELNNSYFKNAEWLIIVIFSPSRPSSSTSLSSKTLYTEGQGIALELRLSVPYAGAPGGYFLVYWPALASALDYWWRDKYGALF